MDSKDLASFDIAAEPENVRAAYGDNRFGQGCLLARRLVERGVRFVEVVSGGWDTHSENFDRMGDLCPPVDRALAALLADLDARGLLDETLVVLATEFGRSPDIVTDRGNGRNHYPKAFSGLLAGGGIRGGQAYGKDGRRRTRGRREHRAGDGLQRDDRLRARPAPGVQTLLAVGAAVHGGARRQAGHGAVLMRYLAVLLALLAGVLAQDMGMDAEAASTSSATSCRCCRSAASSATPTASGSPRAACAWTARDWILKGGKGGAAIEAGEPDKSPLLARISLPDDHDDVMPPDGDVLDEPQRTVIRQWIAGGARFGGWTGKGKGPAATATPERVATPERKLNPTSRRQPTASRPIEKLGAGSRARAGQRDQGGDGRGCARRAGAARAARSCASSSSPIPRRPPTRRSRRS